MQELQKYTEFLVPFYHEEYMDYFLTKSKKYTKENDLTDEILYFFYKEELGQYNYGEIIESLCQNLLADRNIKLFQTIVPSFNFTLYENNILHKEGKYIKVSIRGDELGMIDSMSYEKTDFFDWKTYVSKFTTSRFVQENFYIRKLVLEKTYLKYYVNNNYKNIFDRAIKHLGNPDFLSQNYTEIYYNYTPDVYEKILSWRLSSGNYFHVEVFFLKEIHQDIFVKEYSNSEKREFYSPQGIDKKYIMQYISLYENKPITEIDRKFMIDGRFVTFDEPLTNP